MNAATDYVVDRSVRRYDNGRILVGGSPLVLQRLSSSGAALFDRVTQASPLAPQSALTASHQALVDRWMNAGILHRVALESHWTARDLTVVIPTRNDPIDALLASLCDTNVAHIVVVDDGSSKAVEVTATQRRALGGTTIEVVRRHQAGGPAAARNDGLLRVTTALVAFVDADVTLPADWLIALLAQLDDDRVAIAAPRVRSAPGTTLLKRYERHRSSLDLGDEPGNVRPNTRLSYLPSACLVARTDAVRDGFDPTLRYGEDVDAVWRCVDRGHVVRYDPRSTVVHQPRVTWLRWWKQRSNYGSAAGPLARRHPDRLAPATCHPSSLALWGLLIAGAPVAAVATGSISAILMARKLGDGPDRRKLVWHFVGRGHLGTGRLLAGAIRRAWWPIALVAATKSRAARRIVVASIAALAVEPVPSAGIDRGRWWAIRLADDVAYSTGVWRGAWAARTLRPLVVNLRAGRVPRR
jgi:mycofactocin glycosyltransferase